MARGKSPADSSCPVARALDVVGDRWSLLIIRDAFDGIRRFGEFQESLLIARNILTDRLKQLVESGLLDCVPASDGSAYWEYVLTPKGKALFPVIVTLRQWGEGNLFERGEKHSVLIDRANGKPVPKLAIKNAEGKALAAEGTFVKKVD
ncbi:helix-turn-helix domain-containing protein [Caballeronia sp. dw_276]|jgi:DNA-binding HxlR family transcriptional regulator|uniref:winged helix-turn-helix transcriptional regulator n=1 Tax=Caballeronia sp. dw_276 TaxID=2719795 RepID=UPI001BD5DD4F|nr:helix-turn-helix domain-containing protein [Caballeronia sp. dw_276]